MEQANQGQSQDRDTRQEGGRFGREKDTEIPSGNQPARTQHSEQKPPVSSTLELDFWRENYQHRPYVEPGATYDEYAPAYRYGWEAYTTHAGMGRKFEELEPDLESRWDTYRGLSKLSWEQARHAAKDAWTRIERGGATREADTKWVPMLHDLLQICMDGVKGFDLAADKVPPQHAGMFRQFSDERERCANELRNEIKRRGGDADDAAKKGDLTGAMHRGWINLKAALTSGEKAVIDECERGEDAAVEAYQNALNENALPPDVEVILSRHYRLVKNAHDQVAAIKHAMEAGKGE
ncbi:MAG TPA: PA2169 family four-helix-bundle protein [Phycisphaerales bacterium]|nr:PA2169 family four-helix-bundle protein [Phycisphaerales bacterium]